MTRDASIRATALFIVVVSAVIVIAAGFHRDLDSSFFVKLLFDDAREFAHAGTITSQFMPIGYSGFLGSCLKVGGAAGIPPCQAFLYVGVLFSAFWFLALRGARGALLTIGVLAIILHPVLILNVWRIHDGNLTALLLLGFTATGIAFLRSRSTWSILALGVYSGLLFTVRQNTALLLPLALFLLYQGDPERGKKYASRAAIFLVSAAVSIATVSGAIKGTPFYVGGQGPYNFFAGSNEYTAQYLLSNYSAENSLGNALAARGFSSAQTFSSWLSFPKATYQRLAIEYLTHHPIEYAKLAALKLVTLLRPGYHTVQNFTWNSLEGLKRFSKIVLAAPFFVWVFFVYRTRKRFFEPGNLFVFLVAILYLLPFLIANADPRYRFPLDIILIVDSVSRAGEIPEAQTNSSEPPHG